MRILDASTQLFRRQGYEGTGLKQIVEEGGAPWGSLYHFFPGGKEQLGTEVVNRYGENYKKLIELTFEQTTGPVEAVRSLFNSSASDLIVSDFSDGCPIVAIALDAMGESVSLRQACSEAIDGWIIAIALRLVGYGVEETRAKDLGTSIVAALEGGIALSRIARSTNALTSASDVAVAAVCTALEGIHSSQIFLDQQPARLRSDAAPQAGGS